jgi:trans-aconitate methyltransferase
MSKHLSRRSFVSQGAILGGMFAQQGEEGQAAAQTPAARDAAAETPDQLIRRMTTAFQMTQLVHVAAKLRIADHLASGPKPVAELAAASGSHADSLYRVLRTLAGYGVFVEEDGQRFRLTPAAELLRSDVPNSMRAAAEARGEDWMWRSWGALTESVKTGKTGFDLVYGKNTFDWLAEHPAAARLYDEFQAALTRRSAAAVASVYDFSSARVIADIGGGSGTLLAAVLERNPNARGILFDLPHVVEAGKKTLPAAISRRCEFVGGDFFKAVPRGADAYLLKAILHDWDQEKCRTILGRIREAMAPSAKLLVVEDLVCGPNVPCEAKLGDVNMLVRTGGRNRTEKEYRDLLQSGGFQVTRVLPTLGDLALLESNAVR